MSNIVFEFDADAAAVLAAVDSIQAALEQLSSAVDSITSQFMDINTTAETMSSAWGGLFSSFGQSAQDTTQNTQAATKATQDLQYQLATLGQTAQDAATQHSYAVQQIQQQEADLTSQTQQQIDARTQAYNDSMQQLEMTHQNMVDNITQQEQQLTMTYEDTITRIQDQLTYTTQDHQIRLQETNNQIASVMNQNAQQQSQYQTQIAVKQLEIQQIQQEIQIAYDNGNMNSVANLQYRLESSKLELQQEQANYQTFVNSTEQIRLQDANLRKQQLDLQYNYSVQRDQQQMSSTTQKYQYELTKLQDKLTQENQLYSVHVTDLNQKYQMDLANIETHYQQSEVKLQDHLARENQMYAQQMAKIAAERQHYLTNYSLSSTTGGSGSSSYGVGLTPPTPDQTIALMQAYGIDPKNDPQAAGTLLNDWITGQAYNGKPVTFGGVGVGGVRGTTQMTTQQVQAIATSAIAQSIDPTKDMGRGRNYIQFFSDLLGFTATTRADQSQTQRFGALQYAFEELLAGNTSRALQSMDRLGLTKKKLTEVGVKFNSKGQVEDPANILNNLYAAFEGTAAKPGAAYGLGTYQAQHTMAGLEATLQATKQNIFQEIAQPTSQTGLWAQFEDQLRTLLGLFLTYEPQIVQAGQTIFRTIIDTLKSFTTWIQSSQAHSLLSGIANGIREIGSAFAWMGQHKDIMLLLMGLLTAQGGSTLLQHMSFSPMAQMANGLFGQGILGAAGNLIFRGGGVKPATGAAYTADQELRQYLQGQLTHAQRRQGSANNMVTMLSSMLGYTPDPTLGPIYEQTTNSLDHSNAMVNILTDLLGTMTPASNVYEEANKTFNANDDSLNYMHQLLASAQSVIGYTPNTSLSRLMQSEKGDLAQGKAKTSALTYMWRWGSGSQRSAARVMMPEQRESNALHQLLAEGAQGRLAAMGITPDMNMESLIAKLQGNIGTKTAEQSALGNLLGTLSPGSAGYADIAKRLESAQSDVNRYSGMQSQITSALGYTPNLPIEKQLTSAQGRASGVDNEVNNIMGQILGLGPAPPAPSGSPSPFSRFVGNIFGGAGGRFRAITGTSASIRSAGGIAAAAGVVPAGMGTFEKIAADAGVTPGQARLSGLVTHPLQSLQAIGSGTFSTISGGFTAIRGAVAGMIAVMGPFIASIGPAIYAFFTGLPLLLAGLPAAFAGMAAAALPFFAGLIAAAAPILLVTGLILGLVAVLVVNRQRIMPFIHTLLDFFQKQLGAAMAQLRSFAKEFMQHIKAVFAPGSPTMLFIQAFMLFWEGAWTGIKLMFVGVWNVISGIIKVVWAIISTVILVGLDILSGKWGSIWTDIKSGLGKAWDGIVSILKGAIQIIGGIIIGFFGGLWKAISTPLEAVWSGISAWLVKLGKGFQDNILAIITWFTAMPGKIGSGIVGGIGTLVKNVTQAFGGLITGISQNLDFGSAITSALMRMGNLPAAIMHYLVNHAGPFAAAISAVARKIGIPGFAEGGYYTANRYAVVGEKGPELFLSGVSGTIISHAQIMNALAATRFQGFQPPSGSIMNATSNQNTMGGANFYGPVYITTQTPKDFYRQLNALAGQRAEYGQRGSLS